MGAADLPVPPGGVRPGHLGVIATGRVILGDIAATAAYQTRHPDALRARHSPNRHRETPLTVKPQPLAELIQAKNEADLAIATAWAAGAVREHRRVCHSRVSDID